MRNLHPYEKFIPGGLVGYVTATKYEMTQLLGFEPNAEMDGLPEWHVIPDHNPALAFTVYARFVFPQLDNVPVEWHVGGYNDALRVIRQAMRRADWNAAEAFEATRPLQLAV